MKPASKQATAGQLACSSQPASQPASLPATQLVRVPRKQSTQLARPAIQPVCDSLFLATQPIQPGGQPVRQTASWFVLGMRFSLPASQPARQPQARWLFVTLPTLQSASQPTPATSSAQLAASQPTSQLPACSRGCQPANHLASLPARLPTNHQPACCLAANPAARWPTSEPPSQPMC